MPVYTPIVDTYLRVTDFEVCQDLGTANPGNAPDNTLTYDCVSVPDRDGIVIRLEHNTPNAWAAFWVKLNKADFSEYDTLVFFARGDYPAESTPVFKLELKRQNNTEIGISYLSGLTDEWKQFIVPFDELREFGDMPILCGWDGMSELTFTFEFDRSGKLGVVYLDDIYVERRGEGAPTPMPECIPTQAPILPSAPVIADFNNCTGVNNLGGQMGAAYHESDRLTETYVSELNRGCIAKLEYNISQWSAFWMKLQSADLSPYNQLIFDIRADPAPGIPGQVRIELKRANGAEVSITYVQGITNDWQTMNVDLASFGPTGYADPLSSFTKMEELVFTFEASHSGTQGVIYLDNIALKP